jgi:calcineurin-like phosphoesterase family protein
MIYRKLILSGKQKVFFSSDFHGYHKNICRGTTTWDLKEHGGHDSTRDFATVEEMNECILKGINSTVDQDDWLVFLGDFTFGGEENIKKFRERVLCKNIIYILGNHDSHIANKKEHQELFESVHSYLELVVSSSKYGKQTYNLFHFPLEIWNKGHHNRILLFGHCHGSFQGEGRRMDVGIDNAKKILGEYRPFSQEDIERYMKGRTFQQKSHHNKNTN